MILAHKAWAHLTIALLWEPRDLWFGVYWDHRKALVDSSMYVYVCIVPMLPIRATWPDRHARAVHKIAREWAHKPVG